MRPYHQIPIIESGEPLVEIPLELFAVENPHPYLKLGAHYGQYSPYFLSENSGQKSYSCPELFKPIVSWMAHSNI